MTLLELTLTWSFAVVSVLDTIVQSVTLRRTSRRAIHGKVEQQVHRGIVRTIRLRVVVALVYDALAIAALLRFANVGILFTAAFIVVRISWMVNSILDARYRERVARLSS